MNKTATSIVCASLFLAGCAATGVQVSEQAASQFVEGQSTEAQIVGKLGRPTTTTIGGGIKIISYTGMQYQMKGASFIPIVGAFAGGTDYTMSIASYQIGGDGVLQKFTYSTSGSASRNGTTPADMKSGEPTAIK